ncbi:MAG: hypothetical protein ABIJ10_04340 [Candidatus Micrarchaeota archaeon]
MGIFDKLRRSKPETPKEGPVRPFITIKSGSGLIHDPHPPEVEPPVSVWDHGTGALDLILDTPPKPREPVCTAPSLGSDSDAATVGRIRRSYEQTSACYAIIVSKEDVDVLVHTKEWDLVKYCATNASQKDVQFYAVDCLFKEKRFSDVYDVVQTCGRGKESDERKVHALPLFEQNVEAICNGEFVQQDEYSVGRLMMHILEYTTNVTVARRVVEKIKTQDSLSDLQMCEIRNPAVEELVVDELAQLQEWDILYHRATCLFERIRMEQWRNIVGVLEHNVSELENVRPHHYCGHVLTHLATYASSLEVAQFAIDTHAKNRDLEALQIIATESEMVHQRKINMFGRETILAEIPNANAVEIGKYAVDALANLRREDGVDVAEVDRKLLELTGMAKLPEVQLHAQAIFSAPKTN